MNLLQRVRQQYQMMSRPKAISHRPDLAGREHLYSSYAGAVVNEMDAFADYAKVYSCYAWVKKAITVIADNVASLPVRVVDGNDKPQDNHPLSQLLANVNDEDAPAMLWRSYVVNMMLGGETFYQFVPDGRGRPVEIWMRRPDQIAVVPDSSRLNYPTALEYQFTGEDNQMMTIPAAEMAHDRFYNPLNAWRGLAPIAAVRDGITIDLYNQAWSKKFLKGNARPDFAIIAGQGITQSERDRYEAQFLRKHQGVDNAYMPIILEEGVTDIKTFSFPPKDIEWLQQREFSRDEVAAIFGVPDEIMGFGKDTYENFGTALEVLWTLTLLPIIRSRDTTLTRHMQKYGYGLEPGQRIDTDLTGVDVLQEDLSPKIDMAAKLFAMGVPFNTLDAKFNLGLGPLKANEAAPAGAKDASAAPPILGYHIEQGVVTRNEARAAVGLPPVDETQDMKMRNMRALFELIGAGTTAGLPLETALEMIGLSVQLPEEPPPPDNVPVDETPPSEPPQPKYLLPEGAKEQARRALKKLIQQCQDAHLRALRTGEHWHWEQPDDAELRRWVGDDAPTVLWGLERIIHMSVTGDHDAVNAAYNALKSDANLSRLLEVAALQPFFTVTLPDGPITHEIYKAMVLQLDPDSDDAEQQIRMEVEKRFARDLSKAFGEQLDELVPDDATDDQLRAAVHRVDATSGGVRAVLRQSLEQGSSLGVSVALDTLERIGMSFDWTLAHDQASKWASQYSFDLVRGINSTSQARLQTAVNDWFREPTTIRDLQRELEPTFGKRRAKTIAQTETTRAAHEGSVAGYEQSGVVQEMEWVTVADERVCPQCGPLDEKRAPLRGTFDGNPPPPAHPGCRCFCRPVLSTS